MVVVVATLRTADGKAAVFQAAARQHIANVKANEAGQALAFSLHVSPDDPNQVLFYEQYADEAALAAHYQTPYLGAFIATIRPLLNGPVETRRYTLLAGLDE